MVKIVFLQKLQAPFLSRVKRYRRRSKTTAAPVIIDELPLPEDIPLPDDLPEAYILRLPAELVLDIAAYLPLDICRHLSCTCRRMRNVLGEQSMRNIREKY